MKRNIDQIKYLEHELGRYQKKVGDLEQALCVARSALEEANAGNRETQSTVDALLTAVALVHGEAVFDPDEPGREIGRRLAVPKFSVQEMREKYEIHARRDEVGDTYILGIAYREPMQ